LTGGSSGAGRQGAEAEAEREECKRVRLSVASLSVQVRRAPQAKAYADEPHVIELEACMDGQREPEDLPLAPWY